MRPSKKATVAPTGVQPLFHLNLRPFFVFGFLFIVFISPFMRGLFFAPELLTFQIVTAAAFLFCVYDQVLRREGELFPSFLDWAVLSLVVVYALSLVAAVQMRSAVGELLKTTMLFMVYRLANRAVRGERDLDRFLNVAYAAGVGVALAGVLTAARVVAYPGAYDNGVIMSTLQYKNTLAVYLAAANVLGLALSLKTDRLLPKLSYAAGNLVLVVVILGTQSRGGWVVYPLAAAALLALIPAAYRWRAAYHLVIFLGCALVTFRLFYAHLPGGESPALLKYIVAGAAAAAACQALYHFLALWLNREEVADSARRLAAAGGLAYLGLVLAFYFWYTASAFPVAAAQVLPSRIIARAETISGQDPSFQQRLEYSRDALRIVRDYPLTGAGGGGWNALYHRYASRLYFSTETHNHFFQTWVEAGTVGFLTLLAVWGGFLALLVKFRRTAAPEGTAVSAWAAAVAALTLGVHSAIDFDLSLAAMGIFLYALFGAVRSTVLNLGGRKEEKSPQAKLLALAALAGTILAAAVILPSRDFYAAGVAGAEGARALSEKDLPTARAAYEKALRLDPFTASYAADLAQIWAVEAAANDDAVARYRALGYAREAARREPYNTGVRGVLVNVYNLLREYKLMVAEAEALCAANPLAPQHREILARSALEAARYFLQKGDGEKARAYLDRVLAIPGELPPTVSRSTPALELALGQAAYLKGDWRGALPHLEEAERGGKETVAEAKLWRAAALLRLGEKDAAEALAASLGKEKPEAKRLINEIASLPVLAER